MDMFYKNKAWLSLSILMTFIMQLASPFISEVSANSASETEAGWEMRYNGPVSYSYYTVGDFELYNPHTGQWQQAFCIEHDKPTPPSQGGGDATVYDDIKMAKALYYGWEGAGYGDDPGPGTAVTFGSRDEGIVATSLVLNNIYNGQDTGLNNIASAQKLYGIAMNPDTYLPDANVAFSDTTLTTTKAGNIQQTNTTTFEADPNNAVSFSIPSEVTFKNVTTGATKTGGTVTVMGEESFYFTAPLDYGTDYNSGTLSGTSKDYAPMVYWTQDSATQDISTGVWVDPTGSCSFTIDFNQYAGDTTITKIGTDGEYLSDAKYDIKDSNGTVVANDITTGPNGKVTVSDLPVGEYEITEVQAPPGYTIDSTPKPMTVNAGQTTNVTFTNQEVFFQVEVIKNDDFTGDTAQGDATFEGAEYGIYSDAACTQLLDTVTLDANGEGTSSQIPMDGASRTVYIKEIKAPEGYNLSTTIYPVTVTQTDDTTEVFLVDETVQDNVIDGNVEIQKYFSGNGGNSGEIAPEEGAEFTLTLNSDPTVQYVETTDANGKATFSNIPYGVYTLEQTDAPEGSLPVEETYEVVIDEESEVIYFNFENAEFKSPVKITKLDEETGEPVLVAGTTFKVKDLSTGEWVEQIVWEDSKPTTVDEFQTNDEGYLILPQALSYGDYELYEISAPNGYVLDQAPVLFTVSESTQENGIVEVYLDNAPQMGTIELNKTGEVPAYGTDNELEYVQAPLEGAVFEITAKGDIVTPDGTVRYEAGTEVDTITTDANGHAKSKELYLGTYTVTEVEAPYGYELAAPIDVTLTYAGQDVEVTFESVDVENEAIKKNVQIVKEDIDSGLVVSVPDAGFQIYDVDNGNGQPIKLYNEITGQWEDTFYTDETGTVTLPQSLPYGSYELVEVHAPEGYVVDPTPVPFVVNEDSDKQITIEKSNAPQKGVVTIEKTGEFPVGATKTETAYGMDYDFVFEQKYLEDVTFEIYATEDIVTPDGTVHYTEGELVDTITTGANGTASSKELYLGSYEAIEVEAPAGYVVDPTPIPFELNYAGQEVAITTESLEAQNIWQDLVVKIHKVEEVISYDAEGNTVIETIPSNEKVFGVFLAEDMALEYSKTKEIIPADSMVATATTVDGIATVTEKLPEGKYYVQELDSGDNHILDSNKYYFEFEAENANETMVIDVYGNEINNDLPSEPTVEQPIADSPSVEQPIVLPEDPGQPIVNELASYEFTILKMNEIMDTYGEKWTSHFEPTGEGAQFGLYNEGQLVQTITIGADSTGTVGPLYAGETYELKEIKASDDAYRITDEVLTITVDNTGYVITDSDGNVVELEDETLVVENDLKVGLAEISKKDITGQEELEGATLNLKGVTYPAVDVTWVSDGTTKEFWLPEGTYELTETIPNEGYQLNTETITFEVIDGETTKVTMHNKPIEPVAVVESTVTPETGDASHVFILVVVIVTAGTAIYVLNRRHKRA